MYVSQTTWVTRRERFNTDRDCENARYVSNRLFQIRNRRKRHSDRCLNKISEFIQHQHWLPIRTDWQQKKTKMKNTVERLCFLFFIQDKAIYSFCKEDFMKNELTCGHELLLWSINWGRTSWIVLCTWIATLSH